MKWERQMRFTMHTRGRDMVYATLRHELLDLAVNVAGPMPTGMDLGVLGGQDALGSQAWFDSLPEDLQGLLDMHWKNGADDEEGDDLDALRKGGGKKGGGRAPNQPQARTTDYWSCKSLLSHQKHAKSTNHENCPKAKRISTPELSMAAIEVPWDALEIATMKNR